MAAGITETLVVDGNSQIRSSFSQEVTPRSPRVVTADGGGRGSESQALCKSCWCHFRVPREHALLRQLHIEQKKAATAGSEISFSGGRRGNVNKPERSCRVNAFTLHQAGVTALAWPLLRHGGQRTFTCFPPCPFFHHSQASAEENSTERCHRSRGLAGARGKECKHLTMAPSSDGLTDRLRMSHRTGSLLQSPTSHCPRAPVSKRPIWNCSYRGDRPTSLHAPQTAHPARVAGRTEEPPLCPR